MHRISKRQQWCKSSAAQSILGAAAHSSWKRYLVVLLLGAACDRATPQSEIVAPVDIAPQFASSSQWGPWSVPVNLIEVNSTVQDNQPTLSPDELSLYFASPRPGGLGGTDIWVSRRASVNSPWRTPVNLGAPVNSSSNDQGPTISPDAHSLFFHSDRPGGRGAMDIYVSRRARKHDDFDWEQPVPLGPDVNTTAYEAGPFYLPTVEAGRTNSYFVRGPDPVDIDIYSTVITHTGETQGPAVPVAELNVPGVTDAHATVRYDGKEVLFFSNRLGGLGLEDLYVSMRESTHAVWSSPVNLGPTLNGAFRDAQPSLSFDGRTLLFSSNRPGSMGLTDIWMSTRAAPGR